MQIDVGEQLVAHVSGIRRCGSPWACPTCAPAVREVRALEIERGLQAHFAAGGGALWVTLTLRHHRRDGLADRLAVVAQALGECLRGAGWERRRDRLGYVGSIRAVEITYGENGWHPHSHALLLVDRPIGQAEAADVHRWLFDRWDGACRRQGFGSLSAQHGVDVQVVNDPGDLGAYLAKVGGDGWGPGHELARADAKRGRGGSVTPFEILAEFAATGESRLRALWIEYERATRGKRAIVWSRGLRGRLLPDEREVSDEEAAAVQAEDEALYRALVAAQAWVAMVKRAVVAQLLDEVEDRAAALLEDGTVRSGAVWVERWGEVSDERETA